MGFAFQKLTANFGHMKYAACRACLAYTKNDSVARDKWGQKHANCDCFIFFDTPPGPDWTPELGDLEALASVADAWEAENGTA